MTNVNELQMFLICTIGIFAGSILFFYVEQTKFCSGVLFGCGIIIACITYTVWAEGDYY